MKKKSELIFNKRTKELEIKEKSSLKKWLQDNKIYFETLMTISLTFMGIIVSVISLSIDKTVADIQKEQLEFNRLLNMPVFNVVSAKHRKEYVVDGIRQLPCIEYEIINNGGNIFDGYLTTEGGIEITIRKGGDDKDIFIFLGNTQRFLKPYSYYNAERKSFTIKRDFDNRNIELKNYLYSIFSKSEFSYFEILSIDYVNIQYNDIENKFHNDWYELNGDELFCRYPQRKGYRISLQMNSMTNEEVYNEILNILNNIEQ